MSSKSTEGTELSTLPISRDSSARQTKKNKAIMKSLTYLGKPPLAILEEDLGELTEEDFEILNPHELNIKLAIDKKVDIREKIKNLDSLRIRLSQLIAAEPITKLKIQIKKEEDEIDELLTHAILAEFDKEGKGKRKRKKTHKKSKKKHTKKHRKKHQKKHRKKHTKKK
jgi:hypothetical protein